MKDLEFHLDQQIKKLKVKANDNFWKLVEKLKEAKEISLWESMDYPSWSSYLAQPEIDLQAATVNRYISVYDKMLPYVEHAPQLDIGRLQAIAPHINKKNAKDLIDKANTLSRSDLRRELGTKAEFEPKPQHKCPHCGFEW